MGWFRKATEQNEKQILDKIKNILVTHPFFASLMQEYHIPVQDVNQHMTILFSDLEGKFAEGNGEEIRLSRRLLTGDFFRQHFHFVVHEFYHWIKRRSEALFYFNDDEEIQSFTLAIAWEMLDGKDPKIIEKSIFPIIAGHFEDKRNAAELYAQMVEEAQKIVAIYRR